MLVLAAVYFNQTKQMVVVEFRIPPPLSVEEYRRAQLHMPCSDCQCPPPDSSSECGYLRLTLRSTSASFEALRVTSCTGTAASTRVELPPGRSRSLVLPAPAASAALGAGGGGSSA